MAGTTAGTGTTPITVTGTAGSDLKTANMNMAVEATADSLT